MLDPRPFRGSVYHLQEHLNGTEIEKAQILNAASLEAQLEGSETVLYFTHDYFAMNHDKNSHLKATADAASKVGVKKLVCVCPIEYDLYYSENYDDPITLRTEAEHAARDSFPSMTMLRPNLLFGNYSYFIRYLEQSVIAGRVPKAFMTAADSTKYHPVHMSDLYTAVEDAMTNEDLEGKSFSVNGGEDLRLTHMVEMLSAATGKASVSTVGNLGLADLGWDFFNGITHDRNMRLLAKYYSRHAVDFRKNDYFTARGTQPAERLDEAFFATRDDPARYSHPAFSAYKSVCID